MRGIVDEKAAAHRTVGPPIIEFDAVIGDRFVLARRSPASLQFQSSKANSAPLDICALF
jgi:hypothetical protein